MKLIFALALLLLVNCVYSQSSTQIAYGYDKAGNRISRRILIVEIKKTSKSKATKPSTKSADTLSKPVAEILEAEEEAAEDSLIGVIKVYPTPTAQDLFISSTMAATGADMYIYSLEGRKIYSQKLTELNTTLDVSSFAGGTYFLIIQNEKVKKEFRIIIQK